MQGIPYYEGGLVVSGSSVDGEIQARSIGKLTRFYRVQGVWPGYISNQAIERTDAVAKGFRHVFSETNSFDRLKRGIRAWINAAQEFQIEDRLHQFVRSIEALTKPEISRTRRQFSHRCRTFAGTSTSAHALFEEIYDLRSASEHMNAWETYLEQVPEAERERYASLRAYQAELLAGQVYTRLLSNQVFLKQFGTDENIESFWTLQDHERKVLWGDPVDLEALGTERFQWPK
jgi:hypothetical protein